jgi:hypothetical protein
VTADSPIDESSVGLVFGDDRSNQSQNCVCVGTEQWEKSELDKTTLSE